MEFSGGLGANRESSWKVTPGWGLEAALPLRISLLRDHAVQELGFTLKGVIQTFDSAAVSNPFAGGGNSRGQRATPETGRVLQRGPSHTPDLGSPHALCHRSRPGFRLLCATSSVPSAPNPHSLHPSGTLSQPSPVTCMRADGAAGTEGQPRRLQQESAAGRAPEPDLRASELPSGVCPGYALGGALLFFCPLPRL